MLAAETAVTAPAVHSVAAMKWHRRVLLIAAPTEGDAALLKQRRMLAEWRGGAERDVTVVEIIGDKVAGATDAAAALRRSYPLPTDRFAAALVGKDGHVALRSAHPLQPETLQDTIDAMPMRRAGQR